MNLEDDNTTPASAKPSRSKRKKPSDPIVAAAKHQKDDSARFLALTSRAVRYADFMEELPVNIFEEMRTVAVVDQFFRIDDVSLTKLVRIPAEQLVAYREHPCYPRIREALLAAARKQAGASTLKSFAEMMESQVAGEVYGIAMLGSNQRIRMDALREFTDRLEAKKGREPESAPAFVFPERVLELMALGLKMEKHLGDGGPVIDIESEEIDGGRMNVPEQEEDEA